MTWRTALAAAAIVWVCAPAWADVAILADKTNVLVPEGGTATFQVKLSAAPASNVTVSASRYLGDTHCTITGGSSLTFTTANWAAYQTVTLSWSVDADTVSSLAKIRLSASGLADRFLWATQAERTNAIFVATTGNDSTGDGSSAKPYQTIQKAVWVANSTSGTTLRDTVYVLPGTYAGFWNETSAGAVPTVEVKVYSYNNTTGSVGDNWANTIINAAGMRGAPFVAVRTDTSYTVPGFQLTGFKLLGSGRAGTGIQNFGGTGGQGCKSTFPKITNCVITGFQYGIRLDRRGFVVDNCLLYDNAYGIYSTDLSQPDLKQVYNTTIAGNDIGIFSPGDKGIDVYNSIIYGNTTSDYRCQYMGSTNVITLYNNDIGVRESIGTSPAWNLQGNISANPSFVGGGGDNQYQIGSASPCKNAGSNNVSYRTSQHYDLWKNLRIQDQTIDMGASEAAGATPPVLVVQAPLEGGKFDTGLGILLKADAWDDGSVTKVEFYTDGTLLASLTTAPYEYEWYAYAAGAHTITVKAYDNSGNITSTDVHITAYDVNMSFSPDESWVTVNYKNGNYVLRRPVVSPWVYTTTTHTYWVATNGSDSNPGTQSQPFATIQHASDISVAGDIIYVQPGTYNQRVHVVRSGSNGKPIIYSCAPGALGKVRLTAPPDTMTPMVDLTFDSSSAEMFWLQSVTYVWVNGFIIQGPTTGPDFQGPNRKVGWKRIQGGTGIDWSNGAGNGTKATNNIVLYNCHCGLKEENHGGTNILMEANTVLENGVTLPWDHGAYLPGGGHVLNGNIFFNNPRGFGVQTQTSVTSLTVTRNVVFGNGMGGLYVSGSCNNLYIYNNTWTDNPYGMQIAYGACTNVQVKNNIVAYNTTNYSPTGTGTGNVENYNCFYPAGPSSKGANSKVVDPQFLNRANPTAGTGGDYMLALASPCVNAGTNVGLPYSGTAPDMGAFEVDKPTLRGRYIFYNNSAFDNNDPAANAADDGAIAPDKAPLYPNHTASFSNYTSYSRGINGIMIDIANLPAGTPTAADFTFKAGNDNTPSAWTAAAAPQSVTVRRGAGVNGSDRITIIWADNAIQKKWLQVTVAANSHTGLSTADVFYWGNAIGETGNSASDAMVTPADELAVRNAPHTLLNNPADITDPCDFNRDRKVGPTDEVIVRSNATNSTTALKLITVP